MNSKGSKLFKSEEAFVYKTGKVTEAQLELILEAARRARSGAKYAALGICCHA